MGKSPVGREGPGWMAAPTPLPSLCQGRRQRGGRVAQELGLLPQHRQVPIQGRDPLQPHGWFPAALSCGKQTPRVLMCPSCSRLAGARVWEDGQKGGAPL